MKNILIAAVSALVLTFGLIAIAKADPRSNPFTEQRVETVVESGQVYSAILLTTTMPETKAMVKHIETNVKEKPVGLNFRFVGKTLAARISEVVKVFKDSDGDEWVVFTALHSKRNTEIPNLFVFALTTDRRKDIEDKIKGREVHK